MECAWQFLLHYKDGPRMTCKGKLDAPISSTAYERVIGSGMRLAVFSCAIRKFHAVRRDSRGDPGRCTKSKRTKRPQASAKIESLGGACTGGGPPGRPGCICRIKNYKI